MGETISRRRGRLYYDRGETLLRSRGDFRMGETISRDTGMWGMAYNSYGGYVQTSPNCLLITVIMSGSVVSYHFKHIPTIFAYQAQGNYIYYKSLCLQAQFFQYACKYSDLYET